MAGNTVIRAGNELSLAAWFGGSLMGAIGVERGATAADGSEVAVESRAWSAWQPLQFGAIATQIASGAALTVANRERVLHQRGVATTSVVRTGLLGAAIAATMLAARTGAQVSHENGDANAAGEPAEPDRSARRRLRMFQWAVPALTGALIVVDAFMGEQQRPNQVARGALQRFVPDALRVA